MTKLQIEEREKALAINAEREAVEVELSEVEIDKEKAAIALRAAGATYDTICEALDLPKNRVRNLMQSEESKRIMQVVREAAKLEAVTQGLVLQRKYLDTLARTPVDRDHAHVHAQITKAFATIFDKAALAAGEATERSETKSITITLDAKRELLEQLLESRRMQGDREAIAAEFTTESRGD
jgi:hypothetical protein